jgi:hypothetical protein
MNPKIIGIVIGAVAFLLFMTKPQLQDFDTEFAYLVRTAVGNPALDKSTDSGCRARPADCVRNLKRTFAFSNSDYFVATHDEVSGPGTAIACWGALKLWVCQGYVSVPGVNNGAPLPLH